VVLSKRDAIQASRDCRRNLLVLKARAIASTPFEMDM